LNEATKKHNTETKANFRKKMSKTTVYKLTNENYKKVIGSKEKQNKKRKIKNRKNMNENDLSRNI